MGRWARVAGPCPSPGPALLLLLLLLPRGAQPQAARVSADPSTVTTGYPGPFPGPGAKPGQGVDGVRGPTWGQRTLGAKVGVLGRPGGQNAGAPTCWFPPGARGLVPALWASVGSTCLRLGGAPNATQLLSSDPNPRIQARMAVVLVSWLLGLGGRGGTVFSCSRCPLVPTRRPQDADMQIEAGPRVRGPPHTPHHSPLGPSQSQREPPGHNATVTPVTLVTSATPSTAAAGAPQAEGPPGGGLTPLPRGAPSNSPGGTGALGELLGGGGG